MKQLSLSDPATIDHSVLVALVLLILSAACGDGDDTPSTGGTQATPTPKETRAAADPQPTKEPAEAMSTREAVLAGPRMTLQEYAEACPEKNNPNDSLDAKTWGAIARRWEDIATWLKDTNPPEELVAYHDARLAFAEEALAFVKNKPEDEVSSSNEALAAFSAFDSWDQVNDAIREADSATFEAMRAERCW